LLKYHLASNAFNVRSVRLDRPYPGLISFFNNKTRFHTFLHLQRRRRAMILLRWPVLHGEQAAILCDRWFHNLRFTLPCEFV